jgi:hypothetical protein
MVTNGACANGEVRSRGGLRVTSILVAGRLARTLAARNAAVPG